MKIPEIQDVAHRFYESPFFVGMVGAFAGVLIPAKSAEHKISFRRKLAIIFVGATCAGFATPLMEYFIGADKNNLINALTFVMGMLGMSLAGGIMRIGQDFMHDPWGTIKKWRHGRSNKNDE